MENKKSNFITLKEAAEISGYAPDYIGQLIRSGKLPGKQVYKSVAWVTTPEALAQYAKDNQSQKSEEPAQKEGGLKMPIIFQRFANNIRTDKGLMRLIVGSLYVFIVLEAIGVAFLFYAVASTYEVQQQRNAKERAEEMLRQP